MKMTNTSAQRDDIAGVFLFSTLEDALLEQITGAACKVFPKRGDVLFTHGDGVSHFYYVVQGRVQLSRTNRNGDEKIFALVGAGETFAEALMFGSAAKGYPVDARLLEDAELIAFDVQLMRAILVESVDACFQIMGSMSRRLHELLEHIEDISMHNATYRLVNFLLAQRPESDTGASDIRLSVPKLVIASRLSIQPETLSRILARLREDGLLDSEGSQIVLKDVDRLSTIVAS